MKRPTANEASTVLERCRNDPVWFIETVLGDKGWSAQYEIIEAVRDHKHVAVKSCHSIGKDWIAARVALWFLYSHESALVITTGPTDRQVKKILWRELAKAHKNAAIALGGKPLTQELTLDEDRQAIGFTTKGETDRFSGFHSPNVLVIVDESSGVDAAIQNEIEGVLSSANAHKLDIGNPTDATSEFAQFFKTPGVKKLSYSAFDTPNFTTFGITQEDIELNTWKEKITGPLPAPYLITPEWVYGRFKKWGLSNPWYVSRVLAEFPEAGADTLIPMRWIEASHNRTLEPGSPDVLGVDVARFGTDLSVIARRQGPVLRILKRFGKVDTMTTAGHVRIIRRDTGAERAIVDVIGVGAGVVDRLREMKEPVQEANAATSPTEKDKFVNARAEWYWTMRQQFEAGQMDLDPADEDLAAQLADIRWKPQKGKILIESKEDMERRGRSSPDDADAAAHTFAGQSEWLEKYTRAMKNIGG